MDIGDLALEICIEVDYHLIIYNFWRPRLYPREVDSILGENIKRILKYPWSVLQRDGNRRAVLYLPVGLHVLSLQARCLMITYRCLIHR